MSGKGFFDHDTYFVREHVALMKLTDTYEILDTETQESIGLARECPPGWAKWLRLIVNKQMLPTEITVTEGGDGGPVALRMTRGFTLWRSVVHVTDGDGRALGYFRSKIFSMGGGFWVHDTGGGQVAEVKGDWKGWDFRFLGSGGHELGQVTKKWGGLAKEIFTSADNYVVSIAPEVASDPDTKRLLLAAALAVDMVFKEKK